MLVKNNITGIVLTKNEGKNIKRCLKSLEWCDECLVIDDNSTDNTVKIARKFKVKVYRRELGGNFAKQRNFGLGKANGKWVLFVDADEVVTGKLRDEMVQIINNPVLSFAGYFLKRDDYIWGKKLRFGETASFQLLRLAKKGIGKWERRVHETWNVRGKTGVLKNALRHYPHQLLAEFLEEIRERSVLHAKANYQTGKKSSLLKILIWPFAKFVRNYIFRLGFLDGVEGFLVAMVMSIHSFMAWGTLWLMQKNNG